MARRLCKNVGIGQRQVARQFHVSQSTICRRLKMFGVQCRKRIRAPQYTIEQYQRVKAASRKLCDFVRGKNVIMDDKSYFPLKWDKCANSFYYAKIVIESLRKNQVVMFQRTLNPPNLPQCHPIENF